MDFYSMVLLLWSVGCAYVYAFEYDCVSLLPIEGTTVISSRIDSYRIIVNTCSHRCQYVTGGEVIVTIKGNSATKNGAVRFNSFVLQARRSKTTTPVGSFSLLGLGRVNDCLRYPNSTFVNADSELLSEVKVLWIAPSDQVIGPIEFFATLSDASGSVWQPKSVTLEQQKSRIQVALDGQHEEELRIQKQLRDAQQLKDELNVQGMSATEVLNEQEKENARQRHQEQNDLLISVAEQEIQMQIQISDERYNKELHSDQAAEAAKMAAAAKIFRSRYFNVTNSNSTDSSGDNEGADL